MTDADSAEDSAGDLPTLPVTPDRPPDAAIDPRLLRACSQEEIDEAERNGTLGFLAIEHLVFPDPAVYDLEALADVTGMPAHQIVQLWRSLGFPDPVGGERIFTETDAEMLGNVASLMQDGLLEPDLTLQMSRVIGSSLVAGGRGHDRRARPRRGAGPRRRRLRDRGRRAHADDAEGHGLRLAASPPGGGAALLGP